MDPFSFGELELSVLQAVKTNDRATVHDVMRTLGETRSYTTIMTVMSRLAEKGELLREKIGKQYVYWVAPKKQNEPKGLIKRIQDKIFGGKGVAMVSYLLEMNQGLSDQELSELEALIQERRMQGKKDG